MSDRKETTNPLPDYFHLLLTASRASERVDRFDLRSDDPDSVTEFRKLQTESLHATIALLDYSTAHNEAIKQWLSGDISAMTDRTEIQSNEVMRCPKCGEPHPDRVVQFAKAFGASVALCRKCTAIEKHERFGITNG